MISNSELHILFFTDIMMTEKFNQYCNYTNNTIDYVHTYITPDLYT